MATIRLFEQAMSVLSGMKDVPLNATATNPANPPLSLPTNLPSLITFIASFSALQDWLKLIVIGSVFEAIRRNSVSTFRYVVDSFWITAHFREDDSSYDWMMVWLSKHPSWAKAKDVEINTHSFGLDSSAILVDGEEDDASTLLSGSRKIAYLPSISSSYSIWCKRRLMVVSRIQNQTGYYGRREETLQISILTRSHKVLNEILLEAKKQYISGQPNSISIYISDSKSNGWRHVACRQKRSMRSIVLDPGVKDLLIDDARDFLESKNWYLERGIPFRRGYLLYGPPGTGKTSMIHGMASELGLDVYIVSLSRAGLDDESLNGLISDLPEKCIALMEDIDVALHPALNREPDPAPSSQTNAKDNEPPPPPGQQKGTAPTSRISLSGLLNALDGVSAQEGRILYATTNKYSSLDPALCRPGRMDVHVEFKLTSRHQAFQLFRGFYLPFDEVDDDESEKGSQDSGYGSVSADLIDLDPSNEEPEHPEPIAPVAPETLTRKSRLPVITRAEVHDLAHRFAQQLPEREFSMAGLQGYLMSYKTRPFEAVKDFGKWLEKCRSEKQTAADAPKAPDTKPSTVT